MKRVTGNPDFLFLLGKKKKKLTPNVVLGPMVPKPTGQLWGWPGPAPLGSPATPRTARPLRGSSGHQRRGVSDSGPKIFPQGPHSLLSVGWFLGSAPAGWFSVLWRGPTASPDDFLSSSGHFLSQLPAVCVASTGGTPLPSLGSAHGARCVVP